MKDYCFIVSSAVNSSHTHMRTNSHMNLFDSDVRFNQTVETIISIKDKVDCDIFLVESSVKPLTETQLEILTSMGNVTVIEYSSDISKRVYSSVKKIGKLQNSIESLAMLDFLQNYKETLIKYKRIFKLSGRYKLTNNFDMIKHNNKFIVDKFVFVANKPEYLDTRLYSFDSSLVDYHIDLTKKCLDYMTEIGNNTTNFVSMEECFKKFIEPEFFIQTRVIGVEGNIAHSGDYINE